MSYTIKYYYTSHIGKRRQSNQDNLYCNGDYLNYDNSGTDGIVEGSISVSKQPVFAVFDGMGGEECGEMAAYIASKELSEFQFGKAIKQDLVRFSKLANAKICNYTVEHELRSMGTTAAILKFVKGKFYLCNIGDSKIFQFSDGSLKQISYDHIGTAEPGRKPPLSQNLGIPEKDLIISPYIFNGEFSKKSMFLICSDGLTDMVSISEIEKILNEDDVSCATEKLLQQALDNGGRDNITIVLLCIEKAKKKIFNFNRFKK